MTTEICDVCGRDGLHLVKRPFDSLYNNMPIRLPSVEMYECDRCGEGLFTPEQAREVDYQVRTAAGERLDLLPPGEDTEWV